jgi:hypothetical protein
VSRRPLIRLLAALVLAQATPITPAPAPATTLVVCAPGSPGDTEAAQPTMDAFAKIASEAASWPAGSLRAVYFETAAEGLKRLSDDSTGLALVSLPFFLQHEKEKALVARLQVVEESGALGTWSLAARRGQIKGPEALQGFEITGVPGYAPEFVRGPILGRWGTLPPSARITFGPNVLSALRRAAAGEPVAVVLDAAQTKALSTLPFAPDLEIVASSAPMPGSLLCTVGTRLPQQRTAEILHGLLRLHTREEWAGVLKTMRMTRFEKIDGAALDAARRAFAAAGGS